MRSIALVALCLWLGSVSGLLAASPSLSRPVNLPAAAAASARITPRALRQIVGEQVVRQRTIEALVPRAPVLGGRWSVASANDVRYVAPGIVAIDYEDGHVAGRLVVRIVEPNIPRTWVVLEDREW
jgi:hypothetical protein